ncbi:hypothetical protein HBE99_04450 [Mycobacteroides chelonae]|uniref:hypothetical protein n=1 Tax=Mycobacteroides chelonae TaxID=1774 RepID=UPI001911218F|nr:hypothetical protein [Mycobacteroides chelonae]QQG96196.1 hypothetical protein HBE99_04450 [Mycobacteroides chelonae]
MRESMRDWGPPVSLLVLVIGGASIGLLLGPDAAYWWVPLFVAFVFLPALTAVVLAVIVAVELMWGNDDVLQMLTRMLGSSRRKPKEVEMPEKLQWKEWDDVFVVKSRRTAEHGYGYYETAYRAHLGKWTAHCHYPGVGRARVALLYEGDSEADAIAAAEADYLKWYAPPVDSTERRGGFWSDFRRLILSEGAR